MSHNQKKVSSELLSLEKNSSSQRNKGKKTSPSLIVAPQTASSILSQLAAFDAAEENSSAQRTGPLISPVNPHEASSFPFPQPKTYAMPASSVLARVQNFLPALISANAKLEDDLRSGRVTQKQIQIDRHIFEEPKEAENEENDDDQSSSKKAEDQKKDEMDDEEDDETSGPIFIVDTDSDDEEFQKPHIEMDISVGVLEMQKADDDEDENEDDEDENDEDEEKVGQPQAASSSSSSQSPFFTVGVNSNNKKKKKKNKKNKKKGAPTSDIIVPGVSFPSSLASEAKQQSQVPSGHNNSTSKKKPLIEEVDEVLA